MIERQVIVTWYTPEEKLPEEDVFTIVTISGKIYNVTYDHAFAIATYYKNEGWVFDDMFLDVGNRELTVEAWADLEPYGGKHERLN